MAIIGIDLGTTNSLVCVWRDGKAELVPNSLGEYLTPSAVYADEHQVLWTGGQGAYVYQAGAVRRLLQAAYGDG